MIGKRGKVGEDARLFGVEKREVGENVRLFGGERRMEGGL